MNVALWCANSFAAQRYHRYCCYAVQAPKVAEMEAFFLISAQAAGQFAVFCINYEFWRRDWRGTPRKDQACSQCRSFGKPISRSRQWWQLGLRSCATAAAQITGTCRSKVSSVSTKRLEVQVSPLQSANMLGQLHQKTQTGTVLLWRTKQDAFC